MRSNKLIIFIGMFVTLTVLGLAMTQAPALANPTAKSEAVEPLRDDETETPEASHTAEVSRTPGATQTVEVSRTPGATQTAQASQTVEPSRTPQGTPTDCPNPFGDISGNIFYTAIHTLNCAGVINGTSQNSYSPAGTATRAQFAKIVTLAFNIAPATPGGAMHFTDVLPNNFAFGYIEAGYTVGILSGFDQATCGQNGAVYPCYLPNKAVTRGQLTKLVVGAGGYALLTPNGGQPSFNDVPPSNIFFASIETAFANRIIGGYSDGGFHPNSDIRRDEMAQVVYSARQNRSSNGTATPQPSQTLPPAATNTPPAATNTPPPAATNTPAAGASVAMGDRSFSPQSLTVSVGTTVTWNNSSGRPHTVTADNNAFDSGTVGSGGSFSYTFTTAGTYGYYCQFHGSPGQEMFGTITVTP